MITEVIHKILETVTALCGSNDISFFGGYLRTEKLLCGSSETVERLLGVN
jgi:hypothetical protein